MDQGAGDSRQFAAAQAAQKTQSLRGADMAAFAAAQAAQKACLAASFSAALFAAVQAAQKTEFAGCDRSASSLPHRQLRNAPYGLSGCAARQLRNASLQSCVCTPVLLPFGQFRNL